MAKKKKEQEVVLLPLTEDRGHLVFPFGEDVFKEFISSLLGRPQSIKKTYLGRFSIDVSDLISLHHLIEQRINQQNNASLIQFTARIIYADDSSVLLNSIEELQTYNEVRPVVSTAIHMSWDYLVQFQDKKVPEKQCIQYSLIATHDHKFGEFVDDDIQFISSIGGYISFNIKYTARTWGADIEALLSKFTESVIKKESTVKQFVRKKKGTISLVASGIFFLISLIGTFYATQFFANQQMTEITKFVHSKNPIQETVQAKINFLLMRTANGEWAQFYFKVAAFLIVMFIISIFLGMWTEQTIQKKGPSFLLLTKESKNNKDKVLKKDKKGWLIFLASIVVNIICGIVSSYIFVYLIT